MRLSVSLFFLLVWFHLPSAFAQVPLFDEAGRKFKQGLWDFKFQTSYYEAIGNFNKSGSAYDSLPSGSSYNLLQFDFGTRWIPKTNWGIYISGQIANAESKNQIDTRTNSSYTHTVAGTDFMLYSNRTFSLIPDFYLVLPFTRVDTGEDLVLNDEGSLEVTSRLIGRARFGFFRPFAFAGFTYRDEDRSHLLPYGLGAEIQISRWMLGGELRGYQTVVNDKYSETPQDRQVVASANGGALRFFSVDPSLLDTNFWLKRDIGEAWNLKLGGGTSLTGTSTSSGWTVFAGLSYVFLPSAKAVSQPWNPEPSDDDSSRFQESTDDGVNQEYFYKPTPPSPPPPAPPVKPAEPSVEKQKKQMQKELDQTEFQIELKNSKPAKKKKR
ncbi:MAG: hypothetical protein ACAH59_09140 [Pseudobdellovibrionaceae bacterium]